MIHSILLIGQSNMAGRGRIEEAVTIDKTNISVLRNGRWRAMYRPVNPDRRTSGVCLAESFAERYVQDHPDVKVGLIPCADGGSTIFQWQPGSLLFDHAVYQARLAMRTSTIVAILWHQGESDSLNDRYLVYSEKLETMLKTLRSELGLEDVPILMGGLGDFLTEYDEGSHSQWPQINQQLQKLPERLPLAGYVPADGLGHNGDNLHFNAAALHEFGLRYYEKFRTLEVTDRVFEEKPDPNHAFRSQMEEL